MRTLFYTLVFSLTTTCCALAQDIITLKDGTFVIVKVHEVAENDIKYYEQNKTDGPLRTVSRKSVYKIIYKDNTIETVNKSHAPLFEKTKNDLIKRHENVITGNKGLGSIKSLQFKRRRVTNEDRSGTDVIHYHVRGNGYRLETQGLSLVATREGAWKILGNASDGYSLEDLKVSLTEPQTNPLNSFQSLILLNHPVDSVHYFGRGVTETKEDVHLFSVDLNNNSVVVWISPESFLPLGYFLEGIRYHANFESREGGYLLPRDEAQRYEGGQIILDQNYFSDLVINSDLSKFISKPDVDALNKSLANQKTLSINDLLKFSIGDTPEQIEHYLTNNSIKFRRTEIDNYNGKNLYLVIGEGKMNTLEIKETGKTAYDFVDFCFRGNALKTIRLARYIELYSASSILDADIRNKDISDAVDELLKRCVLHDEMLAKLNDRKPTSRSFWMKTKGDELEKYKSYEMKGTGMKGALIDYFTVDDTRYVCQNIFFGIVNLKDLIYRTPQHLSEKD